MNEHKTIKKDLVNKAVEFLKKDLKQHDVYIDEHDNIIIDNKFIIDCFIYDVDGIYYIKNEIRYFLFLKDKNNSGLYHSKDFYRVYRELRNEMKRF